MDRAVTTTHGPRPRIVVTGANGNVGRNLLAHARASGDVDVVAAVRSDRAAASLSSAPGSSASPGSPGNIAVRVVDVEKADDLAPVLAGATSLVHLSGILFESRTATYEQANVAATQAAVDACRKAGVPHIVLISALGADPGSANRYRRSKGDGERIVEASGLAATIIRTPILLGPDTAGANGFIRSIMGGKVTLLGGGHYLMRPLDIDDLSTAILAVCRSQPAGAHVHELAGPEPIAYRDLVARLAILMGRTVSYGTVPLWAAKLGAAINSRIKGAGITPTVIDVITTSEAVPHNADRALGITLTPLAQTLDKIVTAWRKTT